jgi:hypothetical protein
MGSVQGGIKGALHVCIELVVAQACHVLLSTFFRPVHLLAMPLSRYIGSYVGLALPSVKALHCLALVQQAKCTAGVPTSTSSTSVVYDQVAGVT